MHPSYFQILGVLEGDPRCCLPLSAEASEWLFFVGLWDSVNANSEAIFRQYEDDVLAAHEVGGVLKLLEEVEGRHLGQATQMHRFMYAWTPDGARLEITIRNADLTAEIAKLKSLLSLSLDLGAGVSCSL